MSNVKLSMELNALSTPTQTQTPQKPLGSRLLNRLVGPVILLLLSVGFFWKILLTDQYTWLDSPDLVNLVLPWFQLEAGEWHRGRVPLWDPYIYGGQTLIGQAEPGVAYPLNWLLFWMPLRDGWIRQVYLHWYYVAIHFMGALFCYWLCRDLKRSVGASILAGAAFGFGGYLGAIDWPYMINGVVWTPLVFLYLLRVFRGERPGASAAASGAFLGMSWLSGHHQIPIFISLTVAFVWLFHIFRNGKPEWRLIRLGALFTLILILVSGVQALPAYEYGKLAKRWVNLDQPVGWKEPVPYLVHDMYSFPPSNVPRIFVEGPEKIIEPMIGVVAVTLAFFGLALAWDQKPVRLLTAVAIGGLLFSFGRNNVFHGIIYALVPLVEKARTPAMAIAVFHFGVAVLAAFGVDSLLAQKESRWRGRIMVALVVFGGLLFGLQVGLALAQRAPGDDRFMVNALVAFLLASVLYGWWKNHIGRTAVVSLATFLMLIELGNAAPFLWRNRSDKSRVSFLSKLTENSDIASFLKTVPWPLRAEVSSQDIPFNFSDWYGIDMFCGYQASLPENLLQIGPFSQRAKNMFGVNYSLARKPPGPNYKEVFQGESGLKVYWNPDAFPRVWAVHEAVQVSGQNGINSVMGDERFDLRHKTFMLTSPPRLETCGDSDQVRLLKRSTGSLTIDAVMQCTGMVVISESYFPGWVATVDGKPATIYEAYASIRGVLVGPGKHRIVMKYLPRSVILGAIMTLSGLLIAALLCFPRR